VRFCLWFTCLRFEAVVGVLAGFDLKIDFLVGVFSGELINDMVTAVEIIGLVF
jgi:hypothetical protein